MLSKLSARQRAVLSRLSHAPSKEAIASLMDSVGQTAGFDTTRLLASYLIAHNSLSEPAKKRAAEPNPFWTVVIVAKNLLTREGLARIIASRKARIATTLSSVEILPDGLLPRDRPILLVLGSDNQAANTAAQIESFRQRYPDARIAVVADNHQGEDIVMAFRAGANGYFAQPECIKDFIKGLELVMSGQTLLISAMLPKVIDGRQGLIRNDEQVLRRRMTRIGPNDPGFVTHRASLQPFLTRDSPDEAQINSDFLNCSEVRMGSVAGRDIAGASNGVEGLIWFSLAFGRSSPVG